MGFRTVQARHVVRGLVAVKPGEPSSTVPSKVWGLGLLSLGFLGLEFRLVESRVLGFRVKSFRDHLELIGL